MEESFALPGAPLAADAEAWAGAAGAAGAPAPRAPRAPAPAPAPALRVPHGREGRRGQDAQTDLDDLLASPRAAPAPAGGGPSPPLSPFVPLSPMTPRAPASSRSSLSSSTTTTTRAPTSAAFAYPSMPPHSHTHTHPESGPPRTVFDPSKLPRVPLERSTSTLAAMRSLTAPSQSEVQAANAIDFATHRAADASTLVATCEGTRVRIFDAESFMFKTRECQHIVTVRPIADDFVVDLDNVRCSTCHTKEENWLCLVCHEFFCGRFANKHMLDHHGESGHCVSMSLLDLSVWCYACDMYLNHEVFPPLYAFFARLHRLKFREEPQNASLLADGTAPSEGEEAHLFWENLGPMGELMCSHMGDISDSIERVNDINSQCETCASMGVTPSAAASLENWVCLACAGVFCGRYNSQHMLDHHRATGHPVCLSLQDLSIWCYSCVQYVDHTFFGRTQAVFDHFSRLKFGNREPASPAPPPPARQAHHLPFSSTSDDAPSTLDAPHSATTESSSSDAQAPAAVTAENQYHDNYI